jgi:4-amino-4-deoxy-L-arabinose transferase-like glycosyltransferase
MSDLIAAPNATPAPGAIPRLGAIASPLREIELLLLIILIALIYTTRVGSPPVRGEESRRATATIYLLQSGNWFVPQQQGDTQYMSARPPLQNWLMLPFYALAGTMNAVVIRLPSILAVFGTAILLYLYGRAWMSRLGAFTAALAFATMPQVMELGRTAETDLVFTAFLTAGLLGWHYFHERRHAPALAWTLGYAAIAAATLTKGLQAPVYFVAATCAYLLWSRRFAAIFSLRHALGLAVYAVLMGVWVVPYFLMTDRATLWHVFSGDVAMYGNPTGIGAIAGHLASFPALLIAGLLPWVLLLILFFRKSVRDQCPPLARPLAFAVIAFGVAFPTVWLMIGSKTRFLLNMYPCAALCIGIAVDRAFAFLDRPRHEPAPAGGMTAHKDEPPSTKLLARLIGGVREDLLRFTNILALIIAGTGLTLLSLALYAALRQREVLLAMTLPRAAFFAAACLLLAALAWRKRGDPTRRGYALSLFCLAAFLGLVYNLPVVDDLNRKSQRVDLAFDELYDHQLLPEGQTLVSLGDCPHLINYLHFQRTHATIPRVTPDEIAALRRTGDVYFVAGSTDLPPAYTPIATLSLERYRSPTTGTAAIIGKLPAVKNP